MLFKFSSVLLVIALLCVCQQTEARKFSKRVALADPVQEDQSNVLPEVELKTKDKKDEEAEVNVSEKDTKLQGVKNETDLEEDNQEDENELAEAEEEEDEAESRASRRRTKMRRPRRRGGRRGGRRGIRRGGRRRGNRRGGRRGGRRGNRRRG